jgi:drug/metabolite transporter (DMT)-like permease
MVPNEDTRSAIADRPRHTLGATPYQRLRWLRVAGVVLFFLGFLLASLRPQSAPLWPWQTAGALLCAVGSFVYIGIPGALVVLRHPWAADLRQRLKQSFKHPQLMGVAQAWAGVVWSYVVGAVLLHTLPGPSAFSAYAILLVGIGPWIALVLLDRRR